MKYAEHYSETAAVRAHVYITMGQKSVDARSFEILRRILKEQPEITLARDIVHRQWAMFIIDQQAALKALQRLLPADERRELFNAMRVVITAAGELDGEANRRFDGIKVLFDIKAAPAAARNGGRGEAHQ